MDLAPFSSHPEDYLERRNPAGDPTSRRKFPADPLLIPRLSVNFPHLSVNRGDSSLDLPHPGRGDGQSSSLRERILRLRLAFIFRPGFPKAEKSRIPGAGKSGTLGKRIKDKGYGRWIDSCPCHRPLPGAKAAHIRHTARDGQLGASQEQMSND